LADTVTGLLQLHKQARPSTAELRKIFPGLISPYFPNFIFRVISANYERTFFNIKIGFVIIILKSTKSNYGEPHTFSAEQENAELVISSSRPASFTLLYYLW
jgi:hypothetical protein